MNTARLESHDERSAWHHTPLAFYHALPMPPLVRLPSLGLRERARGAQTACR